MTQEKYDQGHNCGWISENKILNEKLKIAEEALGWIGNCKCFRGCKDITYLDFPVICAHKVAKLALSKLREGR